MLNRRILRIKAFKVLYSHAVTGSMDLEGALARLDLSCESTRELYLFLLGSMSPLCREARARIEAARSKFNPTEEDLHPNERFADNVMGRLLAEDPDFQKLLERKKLSWDQYDMQIRRMLDSIVAKPYYARYMEADAAGRKEDARLFIHIFEEEFEDNEDIAAILEDIFPDCMDELGYALTACCRTVRELGEGKPWTLPELYASDAVLKRDPQADVSSDKQFVHKLLRAGFTGFEGYFAQVCEAVPDWDSDRLFSTDMAIIALALAEVETFPDIPVRVSINEWVEIAKFYGSPKSSRFVNGLVDKLVKSNKKLSKQI